MAGFNLSSMIRKAVEVASASKVATSISVTATVVVSGLAVKNYYAPPSLTPTQELTSVPTESAVTPPIVSAPQGHEPVIAPKIIIDQPPIHHETQPATQDYLPPPAVASDSAHSAPSSFPDQSSLFQSAMSRFAGLSVPAPAKTELTKNSSSPSLPTKVESESKTSSAPVIISTGVNPAVTPTSTVSDNSYRPSTSSETTATGPVITITAPISNAYVNSAGQASVTVSGTCDQDGKTVTVSAKDSSTTVLAAVQPSCNKSATPNFTTTVDISSLTDGTIKFIAQQTDNSNLTGSAEVTNTKDTTVPTVAVTSPAANSDINAATVAAKVFSGTCSDNDRTITVQAGSVSGTTTCTSGAWSKTLDLSALAQGSFTVSVDMSDAAGNSATQGTRTFNKDTIAPSAPTSLALQAPASSPGNSATPIIRIGGLTNGNTATLYADASCTVPTLKATGTSSGATLDLTSSALTEGTINFYATQSDPAGNASSCSSATVAYQYDTSLPLVTISTPAANSTMNSASMAAFTVTGTCSEEGRNVTVAVGAISDTVACTSGAWSKALDLTSVAEGNFTFTANHTDAAGNNATQASRVFKKDTVAPAAPNALALVTPGTSPGKIATPVIRISGVTSGDTVKLYSNNTCSTEKASGTASGTTIDLTSSTLTEGSYTFYAATTDSAGNSSGCSTANVAYEYDQTIPTVAITSPAANTYVNISNQAAFTVSGTCSDVGRNVEIAVGEINETAACNGTTWSKSLNLTTIDDGDFDIDVDFSDAAGNSASTSSRTFKKDGTAPAAPSALTMNSPATSSGTDDTPTIRVSGVTSGDTVKLYSNNTCTTEKASGTASGTTIDLTSSALAEASYNFYATTTDAAGNTSSCSTATVAYAYDNSIPTIAITAPTTNSYANSSTVSSFTVSGTCSENTRTVSVATGAVNATTTCNTGNWTTNLDLSSLAQGDFTVTADLDDAAGNHATQASRVFKKDTVAPSAPTSLALQSPATSPGNDSSPTLTVNGVTSGNTIIIYSDSGCSTPALKGSGIAAAASADITSSALAASTYTFYSRQADPAGNFSDCSSANVVYEYDNSAPTLAITAPAANSYTNATTVSSFTVSGTCSEAGQTVTVASGAASGTVACGAGHTWSKALDYSSISDGDFTVTADMDDAAGNHATQATRALKKDTIAPGTPTFGGSPLRSPASSPGNSATPSVRVSSVVSGDTVKLYTNNTCTAEVASGVATGTTIDLSTSSLAAGSYTFYAQSTDPAGNVSSCSTDNVTYEYDNAVPTLSIESPDANSYVNAANVTAFTIGGNCSETGQTVTVAVGAVSGTVACGAGHTWSKALNLTSISQGDFTATADMDDAAGNHATQATRTFKKDTVAPSAPNSLSLHSPTTSPNTVATPSIRIGGLTSGFAVTLYADSSCTLPTVKATGTAAGTTVDLTSSALAANTYTFYATQTDLAGNESACSSASIDYEYDNSAPTLAITAPAANSYANATTVSSFTVSGTCSEAGQTVTVASGAVSGTVTCGSGHTWSKALDYSSISDGDFTVTADMDDAAGNHATQATRVYKKDVSVPSAPTGIALKDPASSPGSDSNPELTVSGVTSGNTVTLHAQSNCSLLSQKATGTASGASIDLTTDILTANTYTFYAAQTDPAGNVSDCSTVNVTYQYIDNSPTVAITSPDANTYTNASNYTAFTISGTCSETGRTVYIVSGAASATPTCSAGHTWTTNFDTSVLAQGDFAVTADHDNAASVSAVQATRTFKKDTVAPSDPSSLALSSPASSPGTDKSPDIQVGGVANGLTVKLYKDACTTEVASGTATGTTIILTSSDLTAGTYTFHAKAIDPAGNESGCSTDTIAYEYQSNAQQVTGWSMDPADGTTSANYAPTLTGTPLADGTVQLYVGTSANCSTTYGAATAVTNGTPFDITGTLSGDGAKVFSYKFTDGSNVTSDCFDTGMNFTYQTTLTYNLSRTFYTIKDSTAYLGSSIRITRDVSGLAQDVKIGGDAISALEGTHITTPVGGATVSFAKDDLYKDVAVSTFGITDRSGGTVDYDRYFYVYITTSATNAVIGSTKLAQVNLIDTDITGEYFFPHTFFSASDSSNSVTLTLQRMTTGATATVDVEFVGGSAVANSDFTSTTITANFANSNDVETTISVPIANVSGNKSFYAKIKPTSTNTVRAQSMAKVRILDSSESNTCDNTASPFGGGTGADATHPYLICSLDQMKQVPNYVSSYFKVMADIDLAKDMPVIAPSGSAFTGGFDGNERALYRFVPTCTDYCGLFGLVNSASAGSNEIKNINLIFAQVIGVNNAKPAGGLIGNNGLTGHPISLKNNYVSGYLTLNYNYGGLVSSWSAVESASSSFTAENNFSSGMVDGNNLPGVGGTFGVVDFNENDATVTMNYNYNTAIVKNNSGGGVIGRFGGSLAVGAGTNSTPQTLSYFENRGSVICSNSTCGGDIGAWSSTYVMTLSYFKNYGIIEGTSNVGGIVGTASVTPMTLVVDNAINGGKVTGSSTTVGGIVSIFSPAGTGSLTISNSSNTAAIKGTSQVGGLIANFTHGAYATQTLNIQDSTNSGSVTGTNSALSGAAGILGYTSYNASSSASTLSVTGNTNSGAINAGSGNKIAGIVGSLTAVGTNSDNSVTISNNTNTANIGNSGSFSGGVIGGLYCNSATFGTFTVSNNTSTSAASISAVANSPVGGIIGIFSNSGCTSTISNNTNASALTAAAATKYVGGIIGSYSAGTNASTSLITGNTNSGNIAAGTYAGGIIGNVAVTVTTATTTITKNKSSGAISATTSTAGGLIGQIAPTVAATVNVSESYGITGSGDVSAPSIAGGLVGKILNTANSGATVNISDCYTTYGVTTTNASAYIASFVGNTANTGSTINLTRLYALSVLTATNGTSNIGGSVAAPSGNAPVYTNAFWLKNAGGTNSSIADDTRQKTTANLQDSSTYGWTFAPTGGALWTMGTYPSLVNAP